MKMKVIVIALLFILIGCKAQSDSEIKKINSDEAVALLKDNAIMLDVRTESEYKDAHIKGATLLTVDDIKSNVLDVVSDKEQTIIVYCRSGNRSAKAAQILYDMGYHNVYDLGGINNWKYDVVK